MLYYLVIGICIFLLIAVIYISAKPISMGIEARRNIKNNQSNEDFEDEAKINEETSYENKIKVSDEIIKLNKLRKDGLLTDEEFEKAKNKLLN